MTKIVAIIIDVISLGLCLVCFGVYAQEEYVMAEIRKEARERITPQKNNTSGVVGVSRTKQRDGNGNFSEIYSWQATWKDKETGKAVSARFSEKKWGADTAFSMACACRVAKKNIYSGVR